MFHKGQQFGHYTLINQLGKGSFGEVWLAHNQTDASSSPVAIKFPNSEDVDWQAIVQEIGLWVLCGKHPNVLPLIEARIHNGQIVIISEFAPDGSLRDLLKGQGALSQTQTVEMIIGVLDGLAHLHSSGVIHRDLKPENILLQGNTPRLADFGISRVMTTNSMSQTAAGTPYYMAPEAFKYKRNEQTDVWSIGVILYEMLKGSLPFPQRDLPALYDAIVMNDPEPLSSSIPSQLQEIVLKALARRSESRYQTSAEMRHKLHDYQQSLYEQETIPTLEKKLQFTESEIAIEGLQLIPYRKGDKWGFCDPSKNIVIDVKYDDANPFSEGLAMVKVNEKYGYIGKTGREITPIKYDGGGSFSEGLASVTLNNKDGYIDKTGREIISINYDRAFSFSKGLAWVKLNGKCGYIDKTGRECVPIKYDGTYSFSEGLVGVVLNGKWGYIDKTGLEIIPVKYDSVAHYFSEGLACVSLNDKYGYIDRTEREIIPMQYGYAHSFSEGLACVTLNGKYGFIEKTGQEVIPMTYDDAYAFTEGLACVKLNSKWGCIDKTGQEVISITYDDVYPFGEGLAQVRLNNKHGYLDKLGREIIPIKYDKAFHFSKGLAWVQLNGKGGYIDTTGREITQIKYDDCLGTPAFIEGLACLGLNGQYGYIGRDGTEYFED